MKKVFLGCLMFLTMCGCVAPQEDNPNPSFPSIDMWWRSS